MSVDGHRMFYYWNLFPYEDCCRWIRYKNGYLLSLREFAFGISENSFLRFMSFNNALDFKLNARRICPLRIDIGAIYNMPPPLGMTDQSKKSSLLKPTQKEIIFDIDISDYEEVRTCCKGSEICRKCWKYMAFACKILDTALREDFGFQKILWTFSGGRGIHCWVCDEKARTLKFRERGVIADYLQVMKGGAFNRKKIFFNENPHPSLKRALQIIEPEFVKVCVEEQNILGTKEGIEKLLQTVFTICHSEEIKEDLNTIFMEFETSKERWDALNEFLKKTNKWRKCFVIEELMLQYVYPRLDIGVTTVFNHLLKCPFSPHNRTKKICIPFDPAKVDDFDPTTAPDFPSLFEESQLEKEGATSDLKNLQKFREALRLFKEFIDNLEKYKSYA